ncbi:hypothetical protein Tco_0371790 [Tanacetum coccineum]
MPASRASLEYHTVLPCSTPLLVDRLVPCLRYRCLPCVGGEYSLESMRRAESDKAMISATYSFRYLVKKETGSSSRLDDKVVQDKRQRYDNDLQDERQDQTEKEEFNQGKKQKGKNREIVYWTVLFLYGRNEPTSYREAVTSSKGQHARWAIKSRAPWMSTCPLSHCSGVPGRASDTSTCPLSHCPGVPGRASGISTCPLSHCSGVPGRASGKFVRSGYTTALNVVPWETDGESVLREARPTCGKLEEGLNSFLDY